HFCPTRVCLFFVLSPPDPGCAGGPSPPPARVRRPPPPRHDAIVAAARVIASEQGLGAVQIVPVAERAGIAAGTVYRYFPAKTDLVQALIEAVSARELIAFRRAGRAGPGAASALAARLLTYAARG